MSPGLNESLRSKVVEILASIPVFEQFTDHELKKVSECAVVRQFEGGSLVVIADDQGDSMMIILEGQVKVLLNSLDGKEVILSHLYPGDFFGEMSLLDPAPRSATVMTVEKTLVAVVSRDVFLELVKQHPEVLLKMSATLCRRLRQANDKIADLAFRDVAGRVANYLLELVEKEGIKEQKDMFRVRLPSQRELAGMLGTTRETISRVFSQFRDAGYITGQDKCWMVDTGKLIRLL